jgi:catechol 2,3-dioxygenase-like lactoylglutathione lyase family enzyme
MTRLEHANVTVADPKHTAGVLCDLFGWKIRWEGPGMTTGHTVHVGGDESYLALFSFGNAVKSREVSYETQAGLNHIAVVVDDLDATEMRVKAAGYRPENHADYEPGRRFYFREENGIEFEVVNYG